MELSKQDSPDKIHTIIVIAILHDPERTSATAVCPLEALMQPPRDAPKTTRSTFHQMGRSVKRKS
jgi:hypothetical protein